jgi:predicted DNA-binding transcriptional regulator YafY
VRTLFPTQESAAAHVLAYGEQVDLIDPPDLRDALLAAARATLAKYENLTHA